MKFAQLFVGADVGFCERWMWERKQLHTIAGVTRPEMLAKKKIRKLLIRTVSFIFHGIVDHWKTELPGPLVSFGPPSVRADEHHKLMPTGVLFPIKLALLVFLLLAHSSTTIHKKRDSVFHFSMARKNQGNEAMKKQIHTAEKQST